MRVKPQGVARLDRLRYHAFKIQGLDEDAVPKATFCADGIACEIPLLLDERLADGWGIWIAVFPHLVTASQTLTIYDDGGTEQWSRTLSPRSMDLNNSVTCRINKRLSARMRNCEKRLCDQSAFVDLLGVYPYDSEHRVMRVSVTFPEGVTAPAPDPNEVLAQGQAECAMVLESGLNDERRHRVVLSYRVRKDCGDLLFSVKSGDRWRAGMMYMPSDVREYFARRFDEFVLDAGSDGRYESWFEAHRANQEELALQQERQPAQAPLISVVMCVRRPSLASLQRSVESLIGQTYHHWELVLADASACDPATTSAIAKVRAMDPRITTVSADVAHSASAATTAGIAAAHGTHVAFMDQGDTLEPNALYEYASAIEQKPGAALLYCDEDRVDPWTRSLSSPQLKPAFNPDALYEHDYLGHMLMVRRGLFDQISMPEFIQPELLHYDLALKASETGPVHHVPHVLYHQCQSDSQPEHDGTAAAAQTAQARAHVVQAHFARRGIKATVEPGVLPKTNRTHYDVNGDPMVSIIIPTMDHTNLLDACVSSLLAKAGWDNLEVLVVENNSTDPLTFAFYEELCARDKRIRLLRYQGSFNYSKIINFAAAQARGMYLFLLNNDTQAISDGCIRELIGYFQRGEVGLVAPLLLYPDGLVQTAGLALMSDGRLGFVNQNLSINARAGYLNSLACARDYSAVLGAAQMVPKALFDQLGGYNEELAVTYNDVDFCWRVREAGKLVVYTPRARLYHREFATRGHDNANPQRAAQAEFEARLMQERWPQYFANGDPELNPNCDQANPWFKLGRK